MKTFAPAKTAARGPDASGRRVSPPGRVWRRQATAVRQILRGPALQPKAEGTGPEDNAAPPIVDEVLRSPGRPLDAATRDFFEPRFGRSFEDVRIHSDARAAASAQAVNARGYAVGNNIVFGAGRYAPRTDSGRSLLAHELTHVAQQNPSGAPASALPPLLSRARAIQRATCTATDDADTIVSSHTVTPDTIEKPGDSVTVDVRFACDVRSWESHLEKSDGTSLDLKSPQTATADRFTRTWDGMKLFKGIRNFVVDDGEYRHRLDKVKYAYKYNPKTKKSDDLYATGANLVSPTIEVKARAYHGPGVPHDHSNLVNENALADIIKSEMGIGNDTEKTAVAWAVRNQMIRLSTGSVATARDEFQDAHDQAAGLDEIVLTELTLEKSMSADITSGAIKWFSPRSMPKKGESCAGKDCRGGLITVQDDAGRNQEVYAPSWHLTMTHVPIAGARDWYVRFYRLT